MYKFKLYPLAVLSYVALSLTTSDYMSSLGGANGLKLTFKRRVADHVSTSSFLDKYKKYRTLPLTNKQLFGIAQIESYAELYYQSNPIDDIPDTELGIVRYKKQKDTVYIGRVDKMGHPTGRGNLYEAHPTEKICLNCKFVGGILVEGKMIFPSKPKGTEWYEGGFDIMGRMDRTGTQKIVDKKTGKSKFYKGIFELGEQKNVYIYEGSEFLCDDGKSCPPEKQTIETMTWGTRRSAESKFDRRKWQEVIDTENGKFFDGAFENGNMKDGTIKNIQGDAIVTYTGKFHKNQPNDVHGVQTETDVRTNKVIVSVVSGFKNGDQDGIGFMFLPQENRLHAVKYSRDYRGLIQNIAKLPSVIRKVLNTRGITNQNVFDVLAKDADLFKRVTKSFNESDNSETNENLFAALLRKVVEQRDSATMDNVPVKPRNRRALTQNSIKQPRKLVRSLTF